MLAVNPLTGQIQYYPDPAAVTLASLGTGTLDATTVLHGNGTWSVPYILGLRDGTDLTKQASFDLSNIATATTRTINIPNANSTTAQTKAVVASNWLTGMSAQGVFSAAQPTFTDLAAHPTTIGGYGITDLNSLGDARWSLLAHTHTFASLTSKPTTLSGYGITDAVPAGSILVVSTAGVSTSYATLALAKAAATSGQTVRVGPGTYAVTAQLYKAGVNWYFEPGATVTYAVADDFNPIFLFNGADGNVQGRGTFIKTFSTAGGSNLTKNTDGAVKVTSGAVTFECQSIQTLAPTAAHTVLATSAVVQTGGTVRLSAVSLLGDPTAQNQVNFGYWWLGGNGSASVKYTTYVGWSVGSKVDGSGSNSNFEYNGDEIGGLTGGAYGISAQGSDSSAALWVRSALVSGDGNDEAIQVIGSNKLYVTAQKIFGRISANASAGLWYVTADKISLIDSTGTGLTGSYVAAAGGTGFVSIKHWATPDLVTSDPVFYTQNMIQVDAGTVDVFGGNFTSSDTEIGVVLVGGTLRLHNCTIDTSTNATTNPIYKQGGTLVLNNVTLIAESSADSVAAPLAQAVTSYASTANRAVNGNITITGDLSINGVQQILGGGTGASTASGARTNLGATTVGESFFTLANPSAITFPRINADNTVTALSSSAFRAAIGAGTGGGDALVANPLSQFASTTSAQLRGVLSDELGTGAALFDGATPLSFTLTNATGLPISTGVSGLGSNVATWLATPSVANLKTALSDETTVVGNLLSLANPSAISFMKIAADNTVSTRTPAQVLGDILAAPLAAPGLTGLVTITGSSSASTTAPLAISGSVTGGNSLISSITNSSSAGGAGQRSVNSDGDIFDFSCRGSGMSSYGGIPAGRCAVGYTGAASITFMADNASGFINFSTGSSGGSERFRVTTTGVTVTGTQTISSTLGVTGATTLTGGILGTTAGGSATAGNVGEYVSASVVQGSATALTTATPKTVTSISLTAGDWDITGIGAITGASTGTEFDVAIGTTTNSMTGTVLGDTRCQTPTVSLAGSDATLMVPSVRVTISGTTTYYLIVQETFTIGTPAAYGRLSARRVR